MTLTIRAVFGVDFSGAKQAGKNIWIAKSVPVTSTTTNTPFSGGRNGRADRSSPHDSRNGPGTPSLPHLRLVELASLERLAGRADREYVLPYLVRLIRES